MMSRPIDACSTIAARDAGVHPSSCEVQVRSAQRPLNCASRRSTKALMPSLASSPAKSCC